MTFSKIITWTSVLFFYIWNLLKSLYLINLLFFFKKLKKIECVLSEQLINSILHIVEPLIPSYARDTVSSQQRKDQGTEDRRGDTPLFLPGHIRQSTDLELFEGEEGRPHPEETPSPVWESVSFQSTIIHPAAKVLYIIKLLYSLKIYCLWKCLVFCLQGLCFVWAYFSSFYWFVLGLHLIHINFKFLKAETIKKLFSVIILSLKMTQ